MPTLTNLSRPVDAIVQSQLEAKILADTGFIVSALINPTGIDVTGASISSANMSAIQTSINNYTYVDPLLSPTYEAMLLATNSKTAVRYYLNGIAQNGTARTGDIVEWIETQSTTGGGVTLYLTTEGAARTSGGMALCTTIFPDSIQTNFIDSTGVYAQGSPTVASNKTVTIPFTKQSFSGVSVVGINVVGSASMAVIPNSVAIKCRVVGIAA